MKLVKKIIIYIIGFVLGMLSMNLKKVYALEKKEKIVLEDDVIKDSNSFSISKVYDAKIERECPTDKIIESSSRDDGQVEEPTQEETEITEDEPIEIWIPELPEDNAVELTPLEQIAAGESMEEKIRIACDIYGADYDITLAIGRYETGWWKSYACAVKNNPGGMSRNEVPIYYDTIDEGIDAWVQNLANNYFAMGLDTPEKIAEKYCPNNSGYASYLRKMMSYGG